MKITKSKVYEKRILAAFIDLILAVYPAFKIGILLAVIFQNCLNIDMIITWSTFIISIVLIIFKDITFPNGSIGKKIAGIGIYVGDTNEFASKKLKIKRNLYHILNIRSFSIIRIEKTNKSGADIKYNTRVDNLQKRKSK